LFTSVINNEINEPVISEINSQTEELQKFHQMISLATA